MAQNTQDILRYFHLDTLETTNHLHNVQQLTTRFVAYVHGLSRSYQEAIIQASKLHDIGKASIPIPILYKKGQLDETERLIVETHPLTGHYLFTEVLKKGVSFLSEEVIEVTRNVILYHHERWDGLGYPHGRKQEDIPLESRIISIIDVYDALTSERSYKTAWTSEEALCYVETEKGKRFDPTLVATFIEMMRQD